MKALIKEHPVHWLILMFLWTFGVATGVVLIEQMSKILNVDYAALVHRELGSSAGFSVMGIVVWLAVEAFVFLLAAFGGIWMAGIPFSYLAVFLNGAFLGTSLSAIMQNRGFFGVLLGILIGGLPYVPAALLLLFTALRAILAWKERFVEFCKVKKGVPINPLYLSNTLRSLAAYLLLSLGGSVLCTLLFRWIFPA